MHARLISLISLVAVIAFAPPAIADAFRYRNIGDESTEAFATLERAQLQRTAFREKYRWAGDFDRPDSPAAREEAQAIIAALQELRERYPETKVAARAAIALVGFHNYLGDAAAADAVLDQLIQEFPGSNYAYNAQVGQAFDALQRDKDPVAAIEYFLEVPAPLTMDAARTNAQIVSYHSAQQGVVRALLMAGEKEHAAAFVERLVEHYPDRAHRLRRSHERYVEQLPYTRPVELTAEQRADLDALLVKVEEHEFLSPRDGDPLGDHPTGLPADAHRLLADLWKLDTNEAERAIHTLLQHGNLAVTAVIDDIDTGRLGGRGAERALHLLAEARTEPARRFLHRLAVRPYRSSDSDVPATAAELLLEIEEDRLLSLFESPHEGVIDVALEHYVGQPLTEPIFREHVLPRLDIGHNDFDAPALQAIIQDPDGTYIDHALEALANALQAIEQLPDGDEPARSMHGSILTRTEQRCGRFQQQLVRSDLSDAHLQALRDRLGDRPAAVVAIAMGHRSVFEARQPLLDFIAREDERDGMLRAFAVSALAHVGDEQDLPLLRDLAENDPLSRAEPAHLRHLRPPGRREPGEVFPVRRAATRAIEHIEAAIDDIERIERALRTGEPAEQFPRRAVHVSEPPRDEADLREQLDLVDVADSAAVRRIARRLPNEPFSSDASHAAIELLARINTPDARQLLHRIAREEFSLSSYGLAAYHLVRLEPASASQLLRSRRDTVVNHALLGVRGRSLDRNLRSAVQRHLSAEDAVTRSLAAAALLQGVGERELPAALRAVVPTLHRTHGISRLPRHAHLSQPEQYYERHLHAIVQSDATADHLRPLAARQQGRARDLLHIALARRGDVSVREAIRELAADESAGVFRVWAVHALGEIGEEVDLVLLELLADYEGPRRHPRYLLHVAADHAINQLN